MELPLDVVRCNFRRELEVALARAPLFEFKLVGDVDALTLRAEFTALDGEKFILVGTFDDYRLKPPLLDFVEPDTGLVGTARASPKRAGADSFFYGPGIICAPFSRKAYAQVHRDWPMNEWSKSVAHGTSWSQYSTISSMLALVSAKLRSPDSYGGGRMG